MTPQAVLQHASGTGKHQVGRGRANDEQIDIVCADTSIFKRSITRLLGQITRGFTFGGNVPRRDSRPLSNPLIARIDGLFEFRVRKDALWQKTADACQLRVNQDRCSPYGLLLQSWLSRASAHYQPPRH